MLETSGTNKNCKTIAGRSLSFRFSVVDMAWTESCKGKKRVPDALKLELVS